MTTPSNMPSQDPALDSFDEDILESGHDEELDNQERGCGHLDHNAAYVRTDVGITGGPIPRFVALDSPLEYREYGGHGAVIPGWERFPGMHFSRAYLNEGGSTTPDGAITQYNRRVAGRLEYDGDHYGNITAARSHDLIMSVGATHWETPQEYINECREQGLNLKLPSGPTNEPPVVNPMITRCWVIHPHGYAKNRAGIIGYSVLTRVVYTTGPDATRDDPDIPGYAEDWATTGKVNLATPGEPQPEPDNGSTLDDYE